MKEATFVVLKFKSKALKLFSIILVLNILLSLTSGCMMNDTNTQLYVYCKDGLYRLSLSTDGKPQKEKVLSPEIEYEGEKYDARFFLPIWNAPYFFFPKRINPTFTSQLYYQSISNDGKKIIGSICDPDYCYSSYTWIEEIGSNKKFFLDFIFDESFIERGYKLYSVGDAWFSPVKKEIFYIIYDGVYEEDGDGLKTEIWKTDLDLKNKIGLTEDLGSVSYTPYLGFSEANHLYPSVILSPDGEKILFYIYDYLWIMNSDGTGKRNISKEMEKEIGKTEPELEVYVHGLQANFTPDGKKIVMFLEVKWREEESGWEDHEYELWIMDIDGSNKKKLVGESEKFAPWPPPFLLTPDGKKIIFYGTYSETGKEDYVKIDIWIMNIDGSEKKNLTASLHKEFEPHYGGVSVLMPFINISPDGGKIVFEFEYYDETKEEVIFSLGIANTDGSGARDLLKEAKKKYPELKKSLRFVERSLSFFYPCFTPDSKNIIFISYGGPYLWIISDDGKNIVNLSKTFDLKIWSDFIEAFIPGG